MQGVSDGKKSALVATYHFGRLLSYSLLGIIASTLGTVVLAPFLHNNLPRILLGGILILIGLAMCGLPLLTQLEKVGMRFWQQLAPLRKKVFPLDSFGKALFAGLLWGFLPCGLVYGALMMAVVSGTTGSQSPINGAILMFVFGLGTLPMLLATQTVVGKLRQAIGKFHLRQVNGGLLMVAGALIIAMPMLMHSMHGGHEMNHNMSHEGISMNHENMDMNHATMNHDSMSHEMPSSSTQPDTMPTVNHEGMNHESMNHEGMTHDTMNHANMNHENMKMDSAQTPNSHEMHDMSHMNHTTSKP